MRVRTLANPFSCNQRFTLQSWSELFPQHYNILDVEIGFGNGQFLEYYAEQNPTRSLVGFEIRKRLVDFVQEKIRTKNLINVCTYQANAQFALQDMFEHESIARIFIFHPDPWPRQAHHKRRLINQTFLDVIYQKLTTSGCLYIATDVASLWDYMQTTIIKHGGFSAIENDPEWGNIYNTRWREMSLEQNRSVFYRTFKKIIVC